MSKSFFKTFIHDLGDPDTTVASDGLSSSEFTGYIDTGSYILNAAISGSLYGGIPNNKAVIFAGDPATGKTFFALGIVKSFLHDNKDGHVFYFDTESAVTNEMLTSRGIDVTRVAKSEPDSIEKFRHVAYKALDAYTQLPEDKRFPLLMVLDSLSALPSKKETEDMANEKDVRDMSKATLIKAAFRVLRLKLAKAKVPLIVTNHVYAVIGCLKGDANIIMADGSTKNITDVVVGDTVKTLDGTQPVTELFQYNVSDTYEIAFEDGTTVTATPNHKFLTTDGRWVRADELRETDEIRVGLSTEMPLQLAECVS